MTEHLIQHAERYGHYKLKDTINEITLREQLPIFGENKRLQTNAKRRVKAIFKKTGYEVTR